jgi:hypothetical protein
MTLKMCKIFSHEETGEIPWIFNLYPRKICTLLTSLTWNMQSPIYVLDKTWSSLESRERWGDRVLLLF